MGSYDDISKGSNCTTARENSFAVASIGCKTNRYEIDEISGDLIERGFERVTPDSGASVYVVNTCSVTGEAEADSRRLIRKIARSYPGAKVVVTGCYAQLKPADLTALSGVTCVLGTSRRRSIPELIASRRMNQSLDDSPLVMRDDLQACEQVFESREIPPLPVRTRAILKIQDGCDRRCVFCVIPDARGRSRSLAPDSVMKKLAYLGEKGTGEVIITGANLGSWGRDLDPKRDLGHLLHRINNERPLSRLRISSIDPRDLNDGILEAMRRSEVICNHLHLSIQSGSEAVLKNMGRGYTPERIIAIVEKAASSVEGIAIGMDLIAGFPGETRSEFEKTRELIMSLPVSYLHVFPFSSRPGTRAHGLEGKVPPGEARARSREMISLGKIKKNKFIESRQGSRLLVLIEGSAKGMTGGKSREYINTAIRGGIAKRGTEVAVTDLIQDGERLIGRVASEV